jgi:hypothetical protein
MSPWTGATVGGSEVAMGVEGVDAAAVERLVELPEEPQAARTGNAAASIGIPSRRMVLCICHLQTILVVPE